MSLYLNGLSKYFDGFRSLQNEEDVYSYWENMPVVKNKTVIEWINRGFFLNNVKRDVRFVYGNLDYVGCKLVIVLNDKEFPKEWKEHALAGKQAAYYQMDIDRMFLDMQSIEKSYNCKMTFIYHDHIHKKYLDKLNEIIEASSTHEIIEFNIGETENEIRYPTEYYRRVSIKFPTDMTYAISKLISFFREAHPQM